MPSRPSVLAQTIARLRGEVSAATLEAYARNSLLVHELADELERRRREHRAAGLDPWTVPAAARTEQLCAWNAMFLQGLATDLLEADYREEPLTAGYVPPAVAEQALRFFAGVEPWMSRARQARANPAYRLDVSVPAPLPAWVDADALPPSWLPGMLQAMRSASRWAALALSAFPDDPPSGVVSQAQWNRIQQLDAAADSGVRYVEGLAVGRPAPEVARRAERRIRQVIQELYTLGQLVADPWLAQAPQPPRAAPSIVVPCAECGQKLRLPGPAARRLKVTCPRCAHRQLIES